LAASFSASTASFRKAWVSGLSSGSGGAEGGGGLAAPSEPPDAEVPTTVGGPSSSRIRRWHSICSSCVSLFIILQALVLQLLLWRW
jgi:hypothetical protein